MVNGSFVLGIIGGIFAILIAMLAIVLTPSIFSIAGTSGGDLLYTLAGVCAIGGFLGIASGVLGKQLGGDLMVAGSVLALTGGILFGFPLGVSPFILMIAGGLLAMSEKVQVTPKIE